MKVRAGERGGRQAVRVRQQPPAPRPPLEVRVRFAPDPEARRRLLDYLVRWLAEPGE